MLRRASSALLLTAVLAAQPKPAVAPLPDSELQRLRENTPLRLIFAGGQVDALRFRLGLTADHSLEPHASRMDGYGALHVRYRQTYRGVRILGAGLTAHLDAQDRFLEPTAKLFTDISIATAPAIGQAAARAAVLATLTGAPPALEAELVILPERRLVFTDDPSKRAIVNVPGFDEYSWQTTAYRLAWYVQSTTHRDAGDSREPLAWIVDAGTARILRRPSLRASDLVAAAATARTAFHGVVTIDAARDTGTAQYQLLDPVRGGSRVRNLNGGAGFHPDAAAPFLSATNVFGDGVRYDGAAETGGANGQTPAADVMLGIARSWDLLGRVFRQAGLDGAGSPIEARVHYGSNANEAFWSRPAGVAFFGDGAPDAASPTDLETVAHELGHGLWFAHVESEGGADSEADAIAEGSADIFASLVEFYHLGSGGQGGILADPVEPWNFRTRMVDPTHFSAGPENAVPQPGLVYWNANVPAIDEHAAGALYGHVFVLLARGASSDPSNPLASRFFPRGSAGVGVPAAAGLWHLATTAFLPPEPTFAELRAAWLRAAEVLYGSGETNPVRAAVVNAFAAAGMGLPAADAIAPSLTSLAIEEIDEGEGGMRVSAAATDDTGVLGVEFVIGTRTALVLQRPPYAGWIDISGLPPGAHTLTARAIDNGNKVGITTLPFTIAGVNQLVAGGGFEDGASAWIAPPGVIAAGDSFLGARHAAFAGSKTLSQKIAVGRESSGAALSFRLRVDNPGGSPSGARLALQIADQDGAVRETLGAWFDNFDTRDAQTNHYRRMTFNLNRFRGMTIELRFVSTAPEDDMVRFRVDNVSVVSSEPASATAGVDVDEREGSIEFRLNQTGGLRPGQISRVDYVVEEEVVASSAEPPFRAVRELQGFGPRSFSVTALLYDAAGAKLLETAPAAFTILQVNRLVRNGGFEADLRDWFQVGAASVSVDTPSVKRAFLGSRAASLSGRGVAGSSEISQFVRIPAGAVEASLSFRLRMDTQETGDADSFLARVSEIGGQRTRDLLRLRSGASTRSPRAVNGYVKYVFDIAEYAGNEINLFFQGREDGARPTLFLLDNVSVTWK
ncbi:MAG: M4 family metallopeptidase [Bryobacteraceae bacterium]